MNEDPQVVPVEGTKEAPEVSTQTTEAAVVTPETQATPALSLDEVTRLLNERESKLRAEFQEQARRNQSKTDKAYADALRKARVIEESADMLGLDADAVKAAKQTIIDREFETAFAEPNNAQPNTSDLPPTPPSAFVTRDELVQFIAAQGLDANAVDLSKYEGVRRGDMQAEQNFMDDVAIARAKQVEARRTKKQQAAQAQQTGAVKNEFGSIASPVTGAPSAGYDPVAELNKMNAAEPPNDPRALMEFEQKRKKIAKEAAAKMGWQ